MSGPDDFFIVSVAPSQAQTLAGAVRGFPLQHFVHHPLHEQPCQIHQRACTYDIYIDTWNAQRMIENIVGRARRNIWIYESIAVCGETLMVERGYGGYGPEFLAEENALLRMLARLPQLEIRSWKYINGGDGYSYTDLDSGSSGAELLEHLGAG